MLFGCSYRVCYVSILQQETLTIVVVYNSKSHIRTRFCFFPLSQPFSFSNRWYCCWTKHGQLLQAGPPKPPKLQTKWDFSILRNRLLVLSGVFCPGFLIHQITHQEASTFQRPCQKAPEQKPRTCGGCEGCKCKLESGSFRLLFFLGGTPLKIYGWEPKNHPIEIRKIISTKPPWLLISSCSLSNGYPSPTFRVVMLKGRRNNPSGLKALRCFLECDVLNKIQRPLHTCENCGHFGKVGVWYNEFPKTVDAGMYKFLS